MQNSSSFRAADLSLLSRGAMDLETTFVAILPIAALVVLGKWIRNHVGFLRKLFLPSSIIAGTVALLLGPQVLGRIFEEGSRMATGFWPQPVLEIWGALPGLLISIVFAALFLGKPIPNLRLIWRSAGPMVAHGQAIAWGQYVVGISLAVFLLTPVFGLSPLAGALIEISFEGGARRPDSGTPSANSASSTAPTSPSASPPSGSTTSDPFPYWSG